jgi:thiol-disulfide isomerase/thioredoxin
MTGADSLGRSFYAEGDHYFPQGQRKDVSPFTAYDDKAYGTSVASLKGKAVLIGLWSTHCDPSARMLLEMANLYPKGNQYGFQVLAVNFDLNQQDTGTGAIEGGWRAIHKFMNRNKQFFEASRMPVYTPGLGKEGASNFMDIVQSLPALFVIDRQGKLASISIGYKDGFVGEALKRVLVEKPQFPPVAPPPPSAK